jgi:hypothetical protein
MKRAAPGLTPPCAGPPSRKAQAHRLQDAEQRRQSWVAVGAQRFVQRFARVARLFGDHRHAFGARDFGERCGNDLRIAVFKRGLKESGGSFGGVDLVGVVKGPGSDLAHGFPAFQVSQSANAVSMSRTCVDLSPPASKATLPRRLRRMTRGIRSPCRSALRLRRCE